MSEPVRLTMHEILIDFEKLVRSEEHLSVLIDLEKASNEDIDKFYNDLFEMTKKYVPNYRKFFSEDIEKSNYENALKLFKMLYENFTEISDKLLEE